MLGKLFKYDWKAFWKVPAVINIVLVAMTLLGVLSIISPFWESESVILVGMQFLAIALYIIAICAGLFAVSIYTAVRYYKSLYSDEGYLTHTLPVKPWQLVTSKLLVSSVWSIITSVVVILSILVLCLTALTVFGNLEPDFMIYWNEFWEEFNMELKQELGFSIFGLSIYTLASCLVGTVFSTLMMFSSIALGQLFHTHKVAGAFVFYIAEYMIIQTVSSIYSMSLAVKPFINYTSADSFPYNNSYMIIVLLASALASVGLYFLTEYMTRKKLNLE